MMDNINILELLKKYKWLFLASFFSALTFISVKYHLKYPNKYILIITFFSEIGLIYSYIKLLQSDDFLSGFSLVKIISILIIILPSVIFLNEKLTIKKILGLVFAIIAIYLLA
jgi:multidrug transporter EmrE-like cation transporter